VAYRPPAVSSLPAEREVFTLGPEDVISISVYDNEEFNTTQAVRPDGYVAVLSLGDIKAEGRTIDELRQEIEQRLTKVIRRPKANVVVNEYNSRRMLVLGAVAKPGVVKLTSRKNLLEAMSDAGGFGPDADLQRSVLFRGDQLVPINFDKLFKHGDISQNIYIEKNDAIFIASRNDNRVYVLGEVGSAGAYTWIGGLTLLEAIPLAGGYKRDAEASQILIIKGGLADPKLLLVDAKSVLEEGRLDQNVTLDSGDIVYVPKTGLATVERYLDFAAKALQPILGLESTIVLGQGAIDVLSGRRSSVDVNIPINP
jgi:polysaccharide export outer membrane protein